MMDEQDTNQQKKYIRTFEGDKEALEKGNVPDLAPLQEDAKDAPTETPPAPAPAPVPEPVKAQDKPPPPRPSDRIVEPTLLPEPPPPPPPPPPPAPPVKRPAQEVEPLKTYSSDFTKHIKKESASVATLLAAEQDAQTGKTRLSLPVKGKNPIYVAAGIALILAGCAVVYYAYMRYVALTSPVYVQVLAPSPIAVDEREEIATSTSGSVIAQSIVASVDRAIASGNVRLIHFNISTSTDSVFASLKPGAPDALLRNINSSESIAGVVRTGTSQSPFFILSVSSYSSTFSSMLAWETTMLKDLATLYRAYPEPEIIVASTTQSATSTRAVQIQTNLSFVDEVIDNHDVRIYRDSSGRSRIVYGYFDQETLVIARDVEAFAEILNRLASAYER